MTQDKLADIVGKLTGLHDKLANCHPSLSRGKVWCTTCGVSRRVDSADALRYGWPKHCGYTMTIDSPEERQHLLSREGDGRCESCDDTGDVVRIDGEWLGYCDCPAGVALRTPSPNTPEAE